MAKPPEISPYQANDLLLPLSVPIESQSTIRVLDLGRLRFFERGQSGELERVRPPAANQVFVRPREGTPGRRAMVRLENLLAAALERSPSRTLTFPEAEKLLLEKGFEKPFIDGVIRSYVGSKTFKASRDGKGAVHLALSKDARQAEGRRAYSLSFAAELKAQSKQLGRLIGHGPTVGAEREELLRALLARHVPGRYHVATGFVDGFKSQFDILIYDQIDFAPLFRAGNLVVVPPEAVHAIIEVKSTLDASNIEDALSHLDVITFMSMGRPPVFRGVFAFAGAGPAPIAKAVRRHHRLLDLTTATDDDISEPIVNIDQMVTAVCVLGKAMVRTAFAAMPKEAGFPYMPVTTTLDSDAGHASQAGAFFDVLDRFLRYPYEGAFGRASLMSHVRDDILVSDVTPFYESEEWAAPMLLDDDGEQLRDRIDAYRTWLAGGSWLPAPMA